MTVNEALIDSWHRQSKCLMNLFGRMDDAFMDAKPAEESMSVAMHLAHLHQCRIGWLENASGQNVDHLGSLYYKENDEWRAIKDREKIKQHLEASSQALADWVAKALESGQQQSGNYDHPVFYLQHMIWHEGYHFGLLNLALRRAGQEPPEEWEDANIWDNWRLPG